MVINIVECGGYVEYRMGKRWLLDKRTWGSVIANRDEYIGIFLMNCGYDFEWDEDKSEKVRDELVI